MGSTAMSGTPSGSQTAPSRGMRVVEAAKATAKAAAGTPYVTGGKTTAGFDCSGFVAYVLRQVFSEYEYLTAGGITSSPLFEKVTTADAGDVIYFPPGQNPYEVQKGNKREYPAHVGIVVDANWWIGRQTSNLGLVNRTNVWWQSRSGMTYHRYTGLQQVSANYLQHLSARKYA
jgi:cell wall-associated NlpC family hydrolase